MFATSEQLLMEAQKCLESEKKRKLGNLTTSETWYCILLEKSVDLPLFV